MSFSLPPCLSAYLPYQSMNNTDNLSLKKIFIFWLPLASTWLMMAIEQPFLTAIVARLDEAKNNLAAFGIAFAIALILESPIIMLMTASLSLVKNKQSYCKLRSFTFILNILITIGMMILLIPTFFFYITEQLMSLPHEIAKLSYISTIIFLPWPASIGFRRFYQGILIRDDLTKKVAYGTIVRLISMSGSALLLFFLNVKGAYTGAAALSIGVTLEALAIRYMVSKNISKIVHTNNEILETKTLTYKSIISFYLPLSLTTILSLGIHPVVTFFIVKSKNPIESLAVLPAINALVFLFRSMGLSFQEVGITFMGAKNESYKILKKYASILGFSVFIILFLIAFTPLSYVWFHIISGLSIELTLFSNLPTKIMVILPTLSVWISFQRAVIVNNKKTILLSNATFLEVGVIVAVLIVSIIYMNLTGAVAAASAYIIGRLISNTYLHFSIKKFFNIFK